jgi:hypothetical protein
MDRAAYEAAVRRIREHVREGDVYQANLCRVLSAPLPVTAADDGTTAEPAARALAARLAAGNPAPYASAIHVPAGATGTDGEVDPVWVVSASPELYLSLEPGRGGTVVTSGPIKGTARTPDGLTDKDRAENVMITDLVRNDLQHVCRPGTVEVNGLLTVEHHPGLVHLVSRVRGVLSDDVRRSPGLWRHLLAATFPLLTDDPYLIYLATIVGIYVLVAMGFNVLFGYTGQVSLGQVGGDLRQFVHGLGLVDPAEAFGELLVVQAALGEVLLEQLSDTVPLGIGRTHGRRRV